jgi:hypothetical protein
MFYTSPYTTNTTQISMPPAGFKPTIPASERPKTHALDRAATVIGSELELTILVRAAADSCLRPRGYWDRPSIGIVIVYWLGG